MCSLFHASRACVSHVACKRFVSWSLEPIERFSIQQTVDERTEEGGSMLPARIVEEQPRARNRPVREDLDQPSLGQMLTYAVLLKVIGNAEPV